MYIHTIFFWLWKTIDDDERTVFEQELKMLISDPTVLEARMGKPAEEPYRNIVDSSYDYGIVMRFETLAAHQSYLSGQLHERFVANCAYMWSHLKAYDIDEI